MDLLDIVNFSIFSFIEYIAFFYITFTIFRIRISDYIPQVILTSIILLYVSFSLRTALDMAVIAAFSQLVLLCFLLWIMFRMKVLNAILIAVIGYLTYCVIQTVIVSISFLFISVDNYLFTNVSYVLQTITSLVTFYIAYILNKYNVGYSIETSNTDYNESIKLKYYFIAIIIFGFVNIGIIYLTLFQGFIVHFLYGLVMLLNLVLIIRVISKKWNQNLSQKIYHKTMKAMDTGTSIINHTIKNEISKINLLVNQLSEDIKSKYDDDQIEKTIHQILHSTNHMNEMTVRIKEKMEEVDLIISDIHLNDLIREVLASLQQITEDRKIQVNVKADKEIKVQGDQTHIREVLINIINNSIEALKNSSNPQINIEIIDDKRFIKLSVKDNGSGIPKELQDKVFEPFFTTKKTGNNHGLGLTYGYNIMKKHDGDLKIISVEQEGTEVVLSFPIINLKKKRVIQNMTLDK
ncbi:sensor histidine kinase [Chengkuizengella sp. SCS-71B]|uniref:sensor histidine kinase n=1 Tax=Chengkuizengella sp. SCS-71B TaxID=3115290 RepID=UPI0032C24AD2